MAVARNNHGMVATQGKLVIAGGCGSTEEPLSSVEVFDLETEIWSRLPDVPALYRPV